MKGHNEFVFNTATMIEIVQYWLDTKALAPDEVGTVIVTGFAQSKDTYSAPTFSVQVSDKVSA